MLIYNDIVVNLKPMINTQELSWCDYCYFNINNIDCCCNYLYNTKSGKYNAPVEICGANNFFKENLKQTRLIKLNKLD